MLTNATMVMSIYYGFCLWLYLATCLHKWCKILKYFSYHYVLTTQCYIKII